MSRHKVAGAAGLTFLALDLVALFLPGPPPKANTSAIEIAQSLADHRAQLLAGTVVAGFALAAWAVFLGALWEPRDDDRGLMAAAVLGGVFALALQLLGLLLFYGATFQVAAEHEDQLVRGLTDAGNASVELSKFGFAVFIAGVSLAARARLPKALYAGGIAAAAVTVLSTVPLVSRADLTQFGGGVDLVGAAPAIVWILALSLFLARGEVGPVDAAVATR